MWCVAVKRGVRVNSKLFAARSQPQSLPGLTQQSEKYEADANIPNLSIAYPSSVQLYGGLQGGVRCLFPSNTEAA